MEKRLPFTKVSNLSLWSGMSENGVKLYEKEGIISPERVESNGYRKLSISDGDKLFRSRILSGYGFTIKEIASTLKSKSFDEQLLELEEKEERIGSELIELGYKAKYIRENIKTLNEIKRTSKKCNYEQGLRKYFLPVHDQYQNKGEGDGICSIWFKAMPYLVSAVYIDKSVSGKIVYWYGPLIDEIHAVRLGLPVESAIRIGFESQQYVRGFACYPLDRNITKDDYQHLLDFALSNGKEPLGVLITSHLLIENNESGTMAYDEIFLPIK